MQVIDTVFQHNAQRTTHNAQRYTFKEANSKTILFYTHINNNKCVI